MCNGPRKRKVREGDKKHAGHPKTQNPDLFNAGSHASFRVILPINYTHSHIIMTTTLAGHDISRCDNEKGGVGGEEETKRGKTRTVCTQVNSSKAPPDRNQRRLLFRTGKKTLEEGQGGGEELLLKK